METVPFRDHFDATSEADRAVLLSEWPGVLAGWNLTETLDSRAESLPPRLPVFTFTIALTDPASAERHEVALGDGEILKKLFNSPLVQAIIAALLKKYLG
jgi:hypothetical protein